MSSLEFLEFLSEGIAGRVGLIEVGRIDEVG